MVVRKTERIIAHRFDTPTVGDVAGRRTRGKLNRSVLARRYRQRTRSCIDDQLPQAIRRIGATGNVRVAQRRCLIVLVSGHALLFAIGTGNAVVIGFFIRQVHLPDNVLDDLSIQAVTHMDFTATITGRIGICGWV